MPVMKTLGVEARRWLSAEDAGPVVASAHNIKKSGGKKSLFRRTEVKNIELLSNGEN